MKVRFHHWDHWFKVRLEHQLPDGTPSWQGDKAPVRPALHERTPPLISAPELTCHARRRAYRWVPMFPNPRCFT